MLNDVDSLKMWVRSVPEFSTQTSIIELTQTYKQWLKEHFS